MDNLTHLSRRERQIIDVLYARGQATVNEVRQDLPDPPTPMAVRRLIQILEEKGHVKRHKKGREFHFTPTQPRKSAGRTDLRPRVAHLLRRIIDRGVCAPNFVGPQELSQPPGTRLADPGHP